MVAPSSVTDAAARQAVGPKKATACAALRTRATGQPDAMRASAVGPAIALAAIAAAGGRRDTCPSKENCFRHGTPILLYRTRQTCRGQTAPYKSKRKAWENVRLGQCLRMTDRGFRGIKKPGMPHLRCLGEGEGEGVCEEGGQPGHHGVVEPAAGAAGDLTGRCKTLPFS